jgi:hypothetical protein
VWISHKIYLLKIDNLQNNNIEFAGLYWYSVIYITNYNGLRDFDK